MADTEETASVAVEKEKTKRYFGMLIIGGVVALVVVVLFFSMFSPGSGGKGGLEITKDGIKVNLEQPIINQVDTAEKRILSTPDKQIPFTTARINKNMIRGIERERNQQFSPSSFAGKNLVDQAGGFVLASSNSSNWHVEHNDAGYTDYATPIVTLQPTTASLGETVSISRAPMSLFANCNNVRCAVEAVVNELRNQGMINSEPIVEFDDASNTAFLTFTNVQTGGQSYIKAVVANGYWYEAVANYNAMVSSTDTQRDALQIVASFSVIE